MTEDVPRRSSYQDGLLGADHVGRPANEFAPTSTVTRLRGFRIICRRHIFLCRRLRSSRRWTAVLVGANSFAGFLTAIAEKIAHAKRRPGGIGAGAKQSHGREDLAALTLILLAAGAFAILIGRAPAPARAGVLAAYTTDLSQRTPHQAFNARRAAAAIDGAVVAPGATFSFNAVVRGWSADRGFLRAPVSYDGTLIDDYGGGVCETSTTLYNAALLAGCPIVERHAHTFSPSYAPPGRDAAVAYTTADLQFRNPYRSPITIHCAAPGARLVCRLETPGVIRRRASVTSQVVNRQPPSTTMVAPGSGQRRSRWRLRGRDGLTVAVYRSWFEDGKMAGRELVSQDSYLPISRVRWEDR